jgi:uncharacterized membrane protein
MQHHSSSLECKKPALCGFFIAYLMARTTNRNHQKLLKPFNPNISPITASPLRYTSMKNNSHSRCAMLKTLTFTLMHFCIAFGVTYALTGSIAASGLVAAIEPLCNSVGFYFHEKVWQRIEGRSKAATERPTHAWLHHQA